MLQIKVTPSAFLAAKETDAPQATPRNVPFAPVHHDYGTDHNFEPPESCRADNFAFISISPKDCLVPTLLGPCFTPPNHHRTNMSFAAWMKDAQIYMRKM